MSDATLWLMGKKRTKASGDAKPTAKPVGGAPKKSDRHKGKATQLRMHPILRRQLDLLAERNLTTRTAEIAIAIRAHLAKNGLWPPSPDELSANE